MAEAYERGFRSLLWRVRPERLQRGVDLLEHKVRVLHARGAALREAGRRVYQQARRRVITRLVRLSPAACLVPGAKQAGSLPLRDALDSAIPELPAEDDVDFQCDAALGGLARWLRAGGYDARWWPGVNDADLIANVEGGSSILLTTDGGLMRRKVVALRVVPALQVPVDVSKRRQLEAVVARLRLPLKPPRCMACGGRLRKVAKESVAARIPPRTRAWRDDYWLCRRCGKLFWQGTHWDGIAATLKESWADRLAGAG